MEEREIAHEYTITLHVCWKDTHDEEWADKQMDKYAYFLRDDDWFDEVNVTVQKAKESKK